MEFAHGAIQWLSTDAVSTTYTVSGLTFQPKALRFYWVGLQSSTDAASQAVSERRGVGFAVGTSNRRCVGTFSSDTAGTSDCGSFAANDCVVGTVDGTGARDGELDLNSITSDGFTLIVDDQGVANITVFWEAWGGDDITVAVVSDIAEPAATGTQNYSVTGFTSDGANQVVMLAGVQSTAAVNTGAAADSGLHVGFSTGTAAANNVTVCGNSDDASTAMDTDGYCQDGECLSMIVLAGGNPNATATLSAWGTDQFTLNWTARGTTNRRSIFLAIKGGSWQAGAYTINGNSGSATATVSGLSFIPQGISIIGRMTAENTAATATANDRIGFGSGSSTGTRRSMGILDENATASSACEIDTVVDYDSVLSFPSTGGALQSAYDINSMNSDGFQIIVDTAGGVASEWQGYLTFGSNPLVISKIVDVVGLGLIPYRGYVDPDAFTFFGAAGITNSAQKTAINRLVLLLKYYELWGLGEAIYPMIGGSASSHAVNLKSPGTFNLTFNGSWTHSSTGALPNGANPTHAQTGWIPNTQHSDGLASMGYYSRTSSATGTICDIGAYNATGTKQMAMWLRFLDSFYGLANCVGIASVVANTNSQGWFFVSRTASAVNFLQKNTTQTNFVESVATPTVEVYLGARNDDGISGYWSAKECAFAWLGASLNTAQASILNIIITAYQTELGRNV